MIEATSFGFSIYLPPQKLRSELLDEWLIPKGIDEDSDDSNLVSTKPLDSGQRPRS